MVLERERAEACAGQAALVGDAGQHLLWHVQVHAALVALQAHMHDAVAITGRTRLQQVAPVLHGGHHRKQEAAQFAGRQRRGNGLVVPLPSMAVLGGQEHRALQRLTAVALAHHRLGALRVNQVDGKGRPARQRRIEQVDREVAADATIGEPAHPERGDHRTAGLACAGQALHAVGHVVPGLASSRRCRLAATFATRRLMQRHRADQQREAEAHARGHQYRQRRALRQVVVVATLNLARWTGMVDHPLHHAGRKQLLELLAQEPELRAAQRQCARFIVRNAGRDHLQGDRMRAVRLARITRRVVQIGEGQRCIHRFA
ncbi:hypothetical protein D3C71_1227790 [compost metagenome]